MHRTDGFFNVFFSVLFFFGLADKPKCCFVSAQAKYLCNLKQTVPAPLSTGIGLDHPHRITNRLSEIKCKKQQQSYVINKYFIITEKPSRKKMGQMPCCWCTCCSLACLREAQGKSCCEQSHGGGAACSLGILQLGG